MKTRKLGRTGLTVSAIGLQWHRGTALSRADDGERQPV